MLCSFPIHFVPVKKIRPNEHHYPEHAVSLADAIRQEQLWRIPIAIERTSLAVMDGHHRLAAARQLKLKYIPCLLLDYDLVEVDSSRNGYHVNPDEIMHRARTGNLYPPKTTRHQFPSPLPVCNISVPLLQEQPAFPPFLQTKICPLDRYVAGRFPNLSNRTNRQVGYCVPILEKSYR